MYTIEPTQQKKKEESLTGSLVLAVGPINEDNMQLLKTDRELNDGSSQPKINGGQREMEKEEPFATT